MPSFELNSRFLFQTDLVAILSGGAKHKPKHCVSFDEIENLRPEKTKSLTVKLANFRNFIRC